MITVTATQPGYCKCYRNIGDKFEIADANAFSKVWMKPSSKKDLLKLKASFKHIKENPLPKVVKEPEPEDDNFGFVEGAEDDAPKDELDAMAKEELISYGKANCIGLTLNRTMADDTLRDRIREYRK